MSVEEIREGFSITEFATRKSLFFIQIKYDIILSMGMGHIKHGHGP